MFTIEKIEQELKKIKTGADFPNFIQQIKQLGVVSIDTFVVDSRTTYYGKNSFQISAKPQYDKLVIVDNVNKELFLEYLQLHQQGKTDYYTFCKHCSETGIEKWIINIEKMTCIYYDKNGIEILVENI